MLIASGVVAAQGLPMPLLPDADAFKRLADGSARGPGPCLARAALAGMAAPYSLVIAVRNAAYDRGLLPAAHAPVPVISVGNLTLGGTGKTPLVAWLARMLAARGLRPAIVSRGYGAARGQCSDEAAELAVLLPAVPHVANRDRVAGACTAAAAGAQIVLLDDAGRVEELARMLGGVELTQAAREHAREMLGAREREAATGNPQVKAETRAKPLAAPRRGAGNSRGGSARKE